MNRQNFKKILIVAHDLVATAAAIVATFVVRFEGPLLDERLRQLPLLLPPFVGLGAGGLPPAPPGEIGSSSSDGVSVGSSPASAGPSGSGSKTSMGSKSVQL